MENRIFSVLKWVAVLFVAVFLISQLYTTLISPLTIETVYSYSTTSGYEGRGFIVRNETVLSDEVNGSLRYYVENGGRVAKNGKIATVYASSDDAEKIAKAEELGETIEILETIQGYNDLNAADLNLINSKINSSFLEMISDSQNGKIGYESEANDLLMSMDRKQIVTGKEANFNELISSLESEKKTLEGQINEAVNTLISTESGYFIYSTDGYEEAFSVEDLKTVTYSELSTVEKKETEATSIGKIVSDFEWYLLVSMPIEESLKIPAAKTIKLKTDFQTAEELSCQLVSINKDDESEMAVAVFSCSQMNSELANVRYIDLTVVYEEHEGLRINPEAIRFVDSKPGVYVYSASQAKFREVNILYKCDTYCIVEQKNSASGGNLRLYDQIIVKGKNLYDGKYIN